MRADVSDRCALILCLIACFAPPPPLFAQQADVLSKLSKPAGAYLGLEEAVRIGLAHPVIEQAEANSQAASANTLQTKGRRYPWLEASVAQGAGSLRVLSSDGANVHATGDLASSFLRNRSGFHQYGGGRGFALAGALPKHNQNMTTGGLILNQLITDFGATAHRIFSSEATEAASEKEVLTNKALVILNVQQAYFTCLMQQRLVEIARETVTRREAIRDQIQALYARQLKSKLDLDLVAVELRNAELALIKARNDLSQAFAALNHAMGVDGAERYELERIAIAVAPPAGIEPLVAEGIKNRPELLGSRERLLASEELVHVRQRLHYGEISAVGVLGVTKYYDAHDSGIKDNETEPIWGFGVTARLPVFTGFKIQNQVVEAGHRKGEIEQETENLVNDVILQIVRSALNQKTAAEQIGLEKERVAFATEAADLAQERYRLGLSSIVEVVRATTAMFDAQNRLAEAEYVYKRGESLVAYATGREYLKYR